MLAFAVAAALIFQSANFDLVCTGEIVTGSELTPDRTVPWTPRYRINLSNSTWCADECASVYPMVRVSAAELVLSEANGPRTRSFTKVNRSTGRLTSDAFLGVVTQRSTAQCVRAPFTPMPAAQF